MKVLILTEGSRGIGFGHVTRMYAIYQAFEELGIKPRIIIKGDTSVSSVLGDANWEIFDWINDPSGVKEKFGEVDILLIDSYLAPKEVYEHLSKMAKVPAYYDDFGRIKYPCGVVINGNIHAELIDYPESNCARYLRGVKYLPMRKEFWYVEDKNISKDLSSILVTFGGEDSRDMTPLVLGVLAEHFKDYKKFVVIGKGFKEDAIKEIEALSDSRTELVFHPNAGKMKDLMLRADIAISAAGQTLYELARVGVPTVGVVVAENQELQAKVFKDTGFLESLLYWEDEDIESLLLEGVLRLESYELRKRVSEIGRRIVDGMGAKRVIDRLISLVE